MRAVGLGADMSTLRALRLVFAAGLLVGGVVVVLFSRDAPGDHRSRSAVSPSVPAIAPVCRDKAAQFVQTVRTRVDPDGDELPAMSNAALVWLGHAAIKQPSVLETTTLVPFQRPRFLAAASQWLCHSPPTPPQ